MKILLLSILLLLPILSFSQEVLENDIVSLQNQYDSISELKSKHELWLKKSSIILDSINELKKQKALILFSDGIDYETIDKINLMNTMSEGSSILISIKAKNKIKIVNYHAFSNYYEIVYKDKQGYIPVDNIKETAKLSLFKKLIKSGLTFNKVSSKSNSEKGDSKSGSGREIHTGPRGGRYYINSNGKKTYIK